MNERWVTVGLPTLCAMAGLAVVGSWVYRDAHFHNLAPRPIREGEPLQTAAAALPNAAPVSGTQAMPGTTTQAVTTAAASAFTASNAPVPNLPGFWPGFRGPNLDGVSPDSTPLAHQWRPQGPKPLWSVALGEGYAAPSVQNGRVYLLDYDAAAQQDALRCLALADGHEVWRRSYPSVVKRNHGMSRTVPAVKGKYVVTLGPKCVVTCCDALTGQLRWQHNLVAEYGTTVPQWYAGQCPLIDGNYVIVAPSGKALVVAFDLASGKPVWQSPNPMQWEMTHVSLAPMTFQGRKMYVYCGSGGVAGVSAKDGAILWQSTEWRINTATVPTPVPLSDGRIFLSGGYNAGSMMLQVKPQGAGLTVQKLFALTPSVFGSDQQTPIFYKGYLYGTIPGGQLVCLDPSGKQVWASGPTARFGLGPYLIADGILYVMDDNGTLTMAEASPAGYKPLGQARVLPGSDSWGPLALAGTRLLARDLTRMVCLDVGKN